MVQNHTTILSIDVGIKNLSYCAFLVCENKISVTDWQNIQVTKGGIKSISLQCLTEQILSSLEEHFDDASRFDYVIIENQPMLKNGLMKTVSVMIYTFFNMLKMHHGNIKDIRFVSAMNKLKGTNLAQSTYKERKKSSIELCKIYIDEYCPQYGDWFIKQSKKDDYADCLNQGVAFLKNTLKIQETT